jgi:hypothetical protein
MYSFQTSPSVVRLNCQPNFGWQLQFDAKIRRQGSQGAAYGYLTLKVEATNCRL